MSHSSCPKCGATIEGETKSCSSCGAVSISCRRGPWTWFMRTLGDRMNCPLGLTCVCVSVSRAAQNNRIQGHGYWVERHGLMLEGGMHKPGMGGMGGGFMFNVYVGGIPVFERQKFCNNINQVSDFVPKKSSVPPYLLLNLLQFIRLLLLYQSWSDSVMYPYRMQHRIGDYRFIQKSPSMNDIIEAT
jgi:hypothetical protein